MEDVDGWSFIDRWGVWECTLCEFPTIAVMVYVRPEGRPDVRKYETLACIWVEVDADTAAES